MPNLLYVTSELIAKLQQHRAYQFWAPIMENFPIRPIPLDERVFHPRDVTVENGSLYLTSDIKFVYCSDNMLSFMYEGQDLSFRLAAKDGILHTMDGKQFTALLGKVAEVATTSDVHLVNTDKAFHPFFDGYQPSEIGPVEAPALQIIPKAKKASTTRVEASTQTAANGTELILGKYPAKTCEKLVDFRNTSKKSYAYLGHKFDIPTEDVKAIIRYYTRKRRAEANAHGQQAIAKIPQQIREQIVRMKRVSKKSYNYLAARFDLPIETIQDICAEHLKRPRRRR